MVGEFRGAIEERFEKCGERVYKDFFNALGNPSLTSEEIASIEADMDGHYGELELLASVLLVTKERKEWGTNDANGPQLEMSFNNGG